MSDEADADMMCHRKGARLDLHRRDPGVLGESTGNHDVGPFHDALFGNVIFRSLHDVVGLDLAASARPCDRSRRILRVAFLGPAIGPRYKSVDVSLLERAVV